MSKLDRLLEITRVFLKLGSVSFGGPVAHLGYLRKELVAKRGWLADHDYADVVALCQFLPGPSSSQVVFALGLRRAGWAGAVLAGFCFMLPSTGLMILFAYGVTAMGDLQRAGWLHGLKLAAVAVVAQAIWGMGKKLCPDWPRIACALGAGAMALAIPNAPGQIGAIAAGSVLGWFLYRRENFIKNQAPMGSPRQHLWAVCALIVFTAILFGLPPIAAASSEKHLQLFVRFYRSGAMIFGGGHVMLPLLRAELVPTGWITDNAFLAGYGAVQAVPGPLSTFAAYLGTVIGGGPSGWITGLLCLCAIYLPSWLLVAGTLPFWHQLSGRAWAQSALRGANAAVVGILLAALYNPVWKEGVKNAPDVLIALTAFALLEMGRLPAWLIVVACALYGQVAK